MTRVSPLGYRTLAVVKPLVAVGQSGAADGCSTVFSGNRWVNKVSGPEAVTLYPADPSYGGDTSL